MFRFQPLVFSVYPNSTGYVLDVRGQVDKTHRNRENPAIFFQILGRSTSVVPEPSMQKVQPILVLSPLPGGHYMKPTQTMHYFTGKFLKKLPYFAATGTESIRFFPSNSVRSHFWGPKTSLLRYKQVQTHYSRRVQWLILRVVTMHY